METEKEKLLTRITHLEETPGIQATWGDLARFGREVLACMGSSKQAIGFTTDKEQNDREC